ncbi:MAG: HYR domain-containing protein [Saprospiraceae bacterium]|nr:HYR domain-containing protein [Saprospiraceae bacterium]
MKPVLTLILLCMTLLGFAQQNPDMKPVPTKVQAFLDQGVSFTKVSPFARTMTPQSMQVPQEVYTSGWGLAPDPARLVQIETDQPEFLEMVIPRLTGSPLTLLLYKVNVVTPDFQVLYSDGSKSYDVPGVHYRGIVKGDVNSLVSISVFRDQIMGIIADDQGNWNLGILENPTRDRIHICYNDQSLSAYNTFQCNMVDDLSLQEDLHPEGHSSGNRDVGDCLRIWWEIGNSLVVNKGSGAAALAYMTGVVAEVYTMYANESLDMATHTFVVHTTPEPYTGGSSSARLSSFQSNNGTLAGDLAHYVTVNFGYGGIAAGFSGVCNANYDQNMCFSDLNPSYNNVPTYSWTVMVCTHEMGHLIGSRHTHACVWNGNNTAIDYCAGYVEGGCAIPVPNNPPAGGTIMSYCHLQSVGINFNLGFGTQPGDVIRNRVAGASCLTTCGAPAPCTFSITCPANTTVNCGPNPAPASSGNATVQILSGSCSPILTYADNNAGLTLCNGTGFFIRTFSATDGGTTHTCSQTITKVDVTPPVISGTANNVTINCNTPVPSAPILTATDNCGPASISMVETTGGTNCGYTLTRLWTASDDCGNTSTRQQVVTVTDTSPPVAKCRSGHKVYLNSVGEGTINATDIDDGSYDNCSAFTLAVTPALVTCANLGNISVTLTVTDACGNVGSCNSIVEVIDDLKPHMACKGLDIYLDDTGNPVTIDPADLDDGITDNCGVVLLELNQSVFGCADLGKNTVKLTARDLSDNSSECQATIRVYDLIPPFFSFFPPDVTVFCTEESAVEVPIADDNCEVVSLGMNDSQEVIPGGPAGSYLVRRSWWAVDKAGNDVTAEQRVVVLAEGQMVTLCNDDIKTAPSKAPVQVFWSPPKVDDICLGSFAMTQMEGPPSGSFFNPDDTTRITYGYQDAWGSRYECAFHVEVPGVTADYQVKIQQADVNCGDHLISRCTISDLGTPDNASLFLTPKGSQTEEKYDLNGPGTLEMYADGTAQLTASWMNPSGTAGWDGTIWFHHRRSYDGWQAAGGKANTDPDEDPVNWDFFELDASQSNLMGTGSNSPILLQVQQSQNFSKHGLQIGDNAIPDSDQDGGWCAIATLDKQGQYSARGEISFKSVCTNTNLIKNAGEVVTLNGGPFTVEWSNGIKNDLLGDVAPGDYSVIVKDGNNQDEHEFTLVAPTGCTLLWEDHCREANVAVGAAASQISTWQNGTADRAVDGNTDGNFANGSVTSTLAGWQNNWSADLHENHVIESVRIWPRTDGTYPGLDPFYVFVSPNPIPDVAPEHLLATKDIRAIRHEGPMNEAWRMPAGMTGRYIKIQLEQEGRLMLAEVEALVCQKDRLDPVPGAPAWPNAPGFTNGDHSANPDDLSVWPNPTSDELNIYITQSRVAPTSVRIMSMTGQEVYRNELSESREYQLLIPVGSWLSGMYAIAVTGPDGTGTQWVQVQR